MNAHSFSQIVIFIKRRRIFILVVQLQVYKILNFKPKTYVCSLGVGPATYIELIIKINI